MQYHTQPQPNWRDRFTERELGLISNARTYAENDPAGLPGHTLLLIISRLADTLDTLPLHEVAPPIHELLQGFREQRWRRWWFRLRSRRTAAGPGKEEGEDVLGM